MTDRPEHDNPDRTADALPAGAIVSPWNRKRILHGVRVFVGLTVAGLLVLLALGKLEGTLEHMRHLLPWALAVGLAQAAFDVVAGGARIWLLTRAFGHRIGIGPAIVANGGNIFLGGLTPSQTGGGVAQLYVLIRGGTPLNVAMIASLVGFLGTAVALLAAALVVATVDVSVQLPAGLLAFSWGTVGLFLVVVGLFAVSVPRPEVYRGGLRRCLARVPGLRSRLQGSRRLLRLERTLEDFSTLMRRAGRHHPWKIAASVALSALIYLNKFVLGWVVLAGLGVAAPFGQVLYLQAMQYLIVYFAPTPGASGLAEVSAAAIMHPLMAGTRFGAFVLLWRTFSLYLPMLFGGFMLARYALAGERRVSDRRLDARASA
jgi:uncharacterized protein (TIRG00374 family)